jgi:hypothetical protein
MAIPTKTWALTSLRGGRPFVLSASDCIKAEQASTTKFSMNLEIVVPVTLILLQGSQNLHSPTRTTVVMTLINAIKLGHRT